MADQVPGKAWVVVFAGTAVNLCLGILYAWSVWTKALISVPKAGQLITEGPAAGWTYLTNAQAATPFSLCVIIFALLMIPGGRIQDKMGPKVGAITGGLFLAVGCIIAGLMKSYGGLVFGFGVLGGIGMGIGYAAPTPAALSWFGPHKRGLVAGLVVGGYGGAALYISPLAAYLISSGGVTYSWIFLGIFFAGSGHHRRSPSWPRRLRVMCLRRRWSRRGRPRSKRRALSSTGPQSEIVKTWQCYALVIMFIGTTQSGLLIIGNAAGILATAAKGIAFFAANAWILASYGGLVNACGRVGTGLYSDKIGRDNAYTINCLVSALCLFLLPSIIASGNIFLLFLAVGIAYWQYGGGLALMPAYTADFFGPKNLGMNYGLVFLGWGLGFFMTRLGGSIKDWTGSLTWAFILSAIVLIVAVVVSRVTKRPMHATE